MMLLVLASLLTLAKAGSVTVTLTEIGNDVQVQVSGSIDSFVDSFTTGMSNPPTFDLFEEGFLNSDGTGSYKVASIQNPVLDLQGCSGFPSLLDDAEDEYSKVSDNMPAIGFRAQTTGSVDIVQVYVNNNYTPGNALLGSAILPGQSFASLNVQEGVPCSASWVLGGSSDSITLVATSDDDDDDDKGFNLFGAIIGFFVDTFDAVFGFFGDLF